MKPKTPDEPRTEEIIKASSIPLQGGRGVAAAASCKNDVCVLVVDATGPYSVVKAVITSESNDGECCEVQLGCATSWAAGRRRKRVVGAAFADDGALAVAFDDGTLRVAKYKVDRGRVVEALSCACDAEGGDATA